MFNLQSDVCLEQPLELELLLLLVVLVLTAMTMLSGVQGSGGTEA